MRRTSCAELAPAQGDQPAEGAPAATVQRARDSVKAAGEDDQTGTGEAAEAKRESGGGLVASGFRAHRIPREAASLRAAGTPTPRKADNPDAVRRWLVPVYADRRAAEELAAAMRAAVAKQQGEDRLRLLVIQPPDAVKQVAALGPITIPIAETVHSVASLTPLVGELVAGAEAITGRGLFGLGEKLSEEERSLNALIAMTLVAGPLLEAGTTGARAVVQVASRTGRTIEEVIVALKAARSLKNDEVVLREALALRKAGRAIEPRHEAALRKAGAALDEVRGAAAHSRFDPKGGVRSLMSNEEKAALPAFRANVDGPRTADQALAIARRNGVKIPEWIEFKAGGEMKAAYADYRLLTADATSATRAVSWQAIAPKGVVSVRLSEAALASDEALTAVIEHECYELTRVRKMVETSEVTPYELDRLINAKVDGNLHHEAWDIADLRTLEMRAKTPAERAMYAARREQRAAAFDVKRFGSAR